MAFVDPVAAALIREMREARGFSPEALAQAIAAHAAANKWGRGGVDAHTIRRIERNGHVPGPRIAFVISHYFGMRPDELWKPTRRVTVTERERATA